MKSDHGVSAPMVTASAHGLRTRGPGRAGTYSSSREGWLAIGTATASGGNRGGGIGDAGAVTIINSTIAHNTLQTRARRRALRQHREHHGDQRPVRSQRSWAHRPSVALNDEAQ